MGVCWVVYLLLIVLPYSLVKGNNGDNNLGGTKAYIIQVENHLKPSTFSSVEDWYESILHNLPSNHPSEPTPSFLYVYRTAFHGFATRLTSLQAQQLQNKPGIIGIYPNQLYQLHTTRTPTFLGIDSHSSITTTPVPNGLTKDSDGGSNVIVGVVDTGIWPESESFSDEGLSPIPEHWKGVCEGGAKFSKSLCNKKLVGVRYFSAGYEAIIGHNLSNSKEALSARDDVGHGTHTASTVAGNQANNVSFLGYGGGNARGMAVKARIAAYKTCWGFACSAIDIVAGMDKALEDGVDVLSLSLGGFPSLYSDDPIAISAFGAIEKGVFVSMSAGNSGPTPMSVTNVAPWIMTVGAGTIDRKFPAYLVLENGDVISGASLYRGKLLPLKQFFPLRGTAANESFSASVCEKGSLDPKTVRGKIVVCEQGGSLSGFSKGVAVKKAGGVGVVVANDPVTYREGLIPDAHVLPGLNIPYSQYLKLLAYLRTAKDRAKATMTFNGTELGFKPAPVVSFFSSRGPNSVSMYVLKPDVIAPGSSILAAWPDDIPPSLTTQDPRRTQYNFLSGTSMSCPHVSGLAALLKGAHADWSPAMIRSALMTTAYTQDNENGKPILEEYAYGVASASDYGAGHVDPEKANDPGLVYDLTVDDYIDFLCASNYTEKDIKTITKRSVSCKGKTNKPWDLNYPAIVVGPSDPEVRELDVTVTRTVTHVGKEVSSIYSVKVMNPKGVTVTVDPPRLNYEKVGEKKRFKVLISGQRDGNSTSEVGALTWSDGTHSVRSPIVVVWPSENDHIIT